MNRVADTIARALHAHGVRFAFGVPAFARKDRFSLLTCKIEPGAYAGQI